MLRRLYVRLGIATGLLFVAFGVLLVWIGATTSEFYALETTQRINRDIALHAAEDLPLLENGSVNNAALTELAHHVMFINPIVEVYLLTPTGRILAHALPYGEVLRDAVDMAPLLAFMNPDAKLPIFGDDPRSRDGTKIFSVSPITAGDGSTSAYLYTVLNGKAYDGIREPLAESWNLRAGAMTSAAALAAAVLGGFLLFTVMTRRLQRLARAVKQYREDSYRGSVALPPGHSPADEIDDLRDAIADMSQRIETQFDAQQEVDRTRRELIANVSHDLRTPVSSIQGYLETVLVKDLTPEKRNQYITVAHRQCTRLNRLIAELFELSTLEAEGAQPRWESFPILELVQDLVHDHEPRARERGVTLSAEGNSPGIQVVADIAMINRALENLINNALQHTHEGGKITVRVSEDTDRARIEVIDNGVGIAAKDIPHIFDRFYRPASEADPSGHGLGLAIVKRIVELHRSRIAVRSELNAGTRFSFWLPERQPPDQLQAA